MNIGHQKTRQGETVYAELMPTTPLLIWYGFTRKGWRRFWPLATGRTWKEPLTFWWYEIMTDTAHIYQRDGGARTFKQAIWKALDAVNDAVIDLEADAEFASPKPTTEGK